MRGCQDSDVCLDACTCWPVWVMSIVVFCFYFIITFIAFYMTASLYSQVRHPFHEYAMPLPLLSFSLPLPIRCMYREYNIHDQA